MIMPEARCKYGYFGGIGEWGQWEALEDDTFDQCRRLAHADAGGSWHFPESGGAVSKYGKRLDDPEKWQRMWRSIQEGEASDEYSLNRYLWSAIQESEDAELGDWAYYYWLTPRMARTILALAQATTWKQSTPPTGLLMARKLVEVERPSELTPLGRKIAEILRDWDRA